MHSRKKNILKLHYLSNIMPSLCYTKYNTVDEKASHCWRESEYLFGAPKPFPVNEDDWQVTHGVRRSLQALRQGNVISRGTRPVAITSSS